jgi:hypothetical protein
MPTRQQTIADAVEIFESANYPAGLTPSTAWLGIYQTLLWYEPVKLPLLDQLPHIIDANHLNPRRPSPQGRLTSWQTRSIAVNSYLANQLNCPAADVSEKTDLLMKHESYSGMQRQNSLGIAFAGLTGYILEKFGSTDLTYQTEVNPTRVFLGISFAGRSTQTGIDVLIEDQGSPVALVSAKWSVRHDRINDITNECPIYKAAYQRIYRQSTRKQLHYYVITNEFDPSRLTKMLNDTCLDSVVHVHKPAIVDILKLNGRLQQLLDLTDLIELTRQW